MPTLGHYIGVKDPRFVLCNGSKQQFTIPDTMRNGPGGSLNGKLAASRRQTTFLTCVRHAPMGWLDAVEAVT